MYNLIYNNDTKSFSTFKTIKNRANQGDTIFIDLDDTIVDHSELKSKIKSKSLDFNQGNCVSSILRLSKPYKDSIEVIKKLSKTYDLYILTGDSWPVAGHVFNGMDWKPKWIEQYFSTHTRCLFYNKIIYTAHKELLINAGTYLIDNDLDKFGTKIWDSKNKLINIWNKQFPDWESIGEFLL